MFIILSLFGAGDLRRGLKTIRIVPDRLLRRLCFLSRAVMAWSRAGNSA